ncbi:hypothetical protein AHF37_07360 [Paragonimus kellicotti]|nr:hypothetical protein AHF37_07360 [Paragonimus kellicotti]
MCLPKLHYQTFRLNNKNAADSLSVQKGADEQSQEESNKRTRVEWTTKMSHELPVRKKHKKSQSVDFLGASRTILQRFRERAVEVLRIHSKSEKSFNSDEKAIESELHAAPNRSAHSELITTQSCPSIPTRKPCLHMKFINSKKWKIGSKALKKPLIRTNESGEQRLNTSSQLTNTNSLVPSSTALDSLQETDIDYSQLSSLQDQVTLNLNDRSELSNLSSRYEDSGVASVGTVLSECNEDLKPMDPQTHPLKWNVETVDEHQTRFMFSAQPQAENIDQYSTYTPVTSESIRNEEVQQSLDSQRIVYSHDPDESKTDSLMEFNQNEMNNHALSSEIFHILFNSPSAILDSDEPPSCYEIQREGDDLVLLNEIAGVGLNEKYNFKPFLNTTFKEKMDLPENTVLSSLENLKTIIEHNSSDSQVISSEVKQSSVLEFNESNIPDTLYSLSETAEIDPHSSYAHGLGFSSLDCYSSIQQQQDNDNVKLDKSMPSVHANKQILETSHVHDVKSAIDQLKCAASTEADNQSLCTEKIKLNYVMEPEEVVIESVMKLISNTNVNVNESHSGYEDQITTEFLFDGTMKVLQLSDDMIQSSSDLSKTSTQVAEMQLLPAVTQNFIGTLTGNKASGGNSLEDVRRFTEESILLSNPEKLDGYGEQTAILVFSNLQKEDFVPFERRTNASDHVQCKREHLFTQSPRLTSAEEQHVFEVKSIGVSELYCENDGVIFEEVERQTDTATSLFQLPSGNNDHATWRWRLNTESQLADPIHSVQLNCALAKHRSSQSLGIGATDRVHDWTTSGYNPSYQSFSNSCDKRSTEKERSAVAVVLPLCLSQQQQCGNMGYLYCGQSSTAGLLSTTSESLEGSGVFNSINLPSISYSESNRSDSPDMNKPPYTDEIPEGLVSIETTSANDLDIRGDIIKSTTTTVAAYTDATIDSMPLEKRMLQVHSSSQHGNLSHIAVSELKRPTTMISQTENTPVRFDSEVEHVCPSFDQTGSATEQVEYEKTKGNNTKNSGVQATGHSRKVATDERLLKEHSPESPNLRIELYNLQSECVLQTPLLPQSASEHEDRDLVTSQSKMNSSMSGRRINKSQASVNSGSSVNRSLSEQLDQERRLSGNEDLSVGRTTSLLVQQTPRQGHQSSTGSLAVLTSVFHFGELHQT